MRGKSTESKVATGSLLSANSAFVFSGPGFNFFAVQGFFNSFDDLNTANKEKRRAIKRGSKMKEKRNHM